MQEDTSTQGQAEAQEQYVEELAGPDDYWLTLTDAARATRRQDVSIRRWISKGLLPVRRQYVGLNQRTRLVRASDLAMLTPIIDPAGAISSERGRLDLTSIPVQQAQIKAMQQSMLAQFEELGGRVGGDVEALQQALNEQRVQQQEVVDHLQSDIEERFARQHEEIAQQRKSSAEALAQLQTIVEDEVAALGTQTTTRFGELEQQLEDLADQQRAAAAAWQRVIELQQQQIDTLTSHLQQEVQAHQQLAEEVIRLNAQLTEQQIQQEQATHALGQLTQQLDSLTAQLVEQRIRYEQEVRARDQLAQQLAHLASQLVEQNTGHENARQQLLGVLSQQQEQLAALWRHATEQTQRYELLSQLYVTTEQRAATLEQHLADLYHLFEQRPGTTQPLDFENTGGER